MGFHQAPMSRGPAPVYHAAPVYRGAPVYHPAPMAPVGRPLPGTVYARPGWGVRAWNGRAPVMVLGPRWTVGGPGRVWIGPHWGWNAGVSVWIDSGWYAPPYAGWTWVPGHWVWNGYQWVWQDGAWVPGV